MKVTYLTWGETPRSYGVFGSQVIGQVRATRNFFPDVSIDLVSGVPIIHSGFIREKWRYARQISTIVKNLGGIPFTRVLILASQNFVYPSKNTFYLFHNIFTYFGLYRYLKKSKPNIVHCRGYHATVAALNLKERLQLSYKVIFDARGLWPEETLLKKGTLSAENDYQYFKDLERRLLENSDAIIAVSDTMAEYFAHLAPEGKLIASVYLSANPGLNVRQFQGLEKDVSTTLGYVGALSEGTWHSPRDLLCLYQKFRQEVPNPKLLIVTTSDHDKIRECFNEVPPSEIEIVAAYSAEEVSQLLGKMNFGALPYLVPKSNHQKILAKSILAVKTAEYVMHGLPILCNQTCGGASYLISQNQLGITYNPNTLSEISRANLGLYMKDGITAQVQQRAKGLLSYESNAERLYSLYSQLCL